MDDNELMLMKALSAVAHLIEYIDTESPFDMVAAAACLNDADLANWIGQHDVLLPLRRDGQSQPARLATLVHTVGR